MRRAIYGGSFNPIHNDHVKLALQFAKQFELDRVTLIPTNITPLKDNSHIAAGEHRCSRSAISSSGAKGGAIHPTPSPR